MTVNQIIEMINKALGKNVKSNHVPERAGDVKHSLADITAATELIGFKPVISFEDGLQIAIDWYKNNLS